MAYETPETVNDTPTHKAALGVTADIAELIARLPHALKLINGIGRICAAVAQPTAGQVDSLGDAEDALYGAALAKTALSGLAGVIEDLQRQLETPSIAAVNAYLVHGGSDVHWEKIHASARAELAGVLSSTGADSGTAGVLSGELPIVATHDAGLTIAH